MSFTLDKIFTTATALKGVSTMKEITPCDPLKPYIRCFWESDGMSADAELRIIPDCCADIMIYSFDNKVRCDFCGVCDKSFISRGNVKTFGIRFYAWSARLFSSVDMTETLNGYFPADSFFRNFGDVAEEINRADTVRDRIDIAQNYLLKTLRRTGENNDVMNGLYKIIADRANVKVAELSDYCAVSKRALERGFRACTGLSPKQAIESIRYQLLWQQCLRPDFDILDSVEKFGYFDAAHLYRDFKKFHGISLPQAAKSNKLSHFYNTLQ